MQEYQFPSIIIFKGDHSQHVTKVLDISGQWAFIVPLGELQKLHPISKHKVVQHEPLVPTTIGTFPTWTFQVG
jgi:hypothetical protein